MLTHEDVAAELWDEQFLGLGGRVQSSFNPLLSNEI